MVTTRATHGGIRLLVTGIIAGMIAGAVMAMYAMIASLTFLAQVGWRRARDTDQMYRIAALGRAILYIDPVTRCDEGKVVS